MNNIHNCRNKRNHRHNTHLTWINHSQSTDLERSVKSFTGGFKISLRRVNPHPHFNCSSDIDLFGPHEGSLTHQWFNPGNKEITIQPGGINDEGSTVKRVETSDEPHNATGTLEQKETNSWTPMGQETDKNSGPDQLTSSLRSEPSWSLNPDPPACN